MDLTADAVSQLSTPGPVPMSVSRSFVDSSLIALLHNDSAWILPAAVETGSPSFPADTWVRAVPIAVAAADVGPG